MASSSTTPAGTSGTTSIERTRDSHATRRRWRPSSSPGRSVYPAKLQPRVPRRRLALRAPARARPGVPRRRREYISIREAVSCRGLCLRSCCQRPVGNLQGQGPRPRLFLCQGAFLAKRFRGLDNRRCRRSDVVTLLARFQSLRTPTPQATSSHLVERHERLAGFVTGRRQNPGDSSASQ